MVNVSRCRPGIPKLQ